MNDIRDMLQVRGLLPPPIYATLCICVCAHSYTNINTGSQYRLTNTEGYDYAFIMCGDLYALTSSKVSTWAVPATRLMETAFRAKPF